jgi:hypothetical protein
LTSPTSFTPPQGNTAELPDGEAAPGGFQRSPLAKQESAFLV